MSKKGRRKERERAEKAGKHRSYSTLKDHERSKGILTPPILKVPGLNLTSWITNRPPEVVWGALLLEGVGRKDALNAFRMVARLVYDARPDAGDGDLSLTGIAALASDLRNRILTALCDPPEGRNALRPLLLFDDLPARADWARVIVEDAVPADWDQLARAVAPIIDHQSQEATDLRWMRIFGRIAAGKLYLPADDGGIGEEIIGYPDVGDLRKVRPTIRAMEIGFSDLFGDQPPAWPRAFWDRCLASTPCSPLPFPYRSLAGVGTTLDQVRRVATLLAAHSATTTTTSEVDARYDAVFGIASFALQLLEELLRIGNGTGILGRTGLRTLLEALITLAHLAKVDDPNVWQGYRSYGAGQAKLAFLKLDELTEVSSEGLPTSIDIELLRALANEDRWQEYTPIKLGHWDGSNLRSLSESSGEKAAYDQFYGWTSSFVHVNWAAVRATAFDLCGNPLHRYHRVMRDSGVQLGDVVADASGLVDRILDLVARMYPGFTARVTVRGTEQ